MNLGSWMVLVVVIALLGFAIKATLFKSKKAQGKCCDVGDRYESHAGASMLSKNIQEASSCSGICSGGCNGCPSMNGCSAVNKNAVLPIVKPQ